MEKLRNKTLKLKSKKSTNFLRPIVQPNSEYTYNEIGELIRDNNDRTGKDLTIKYDAYGKVSEVKDNNVLLAQYTYNERGQRVRKKVFSPTGEAKTTFYVRDAGGNVLSIYEADESESLPMTQKELPIYGMSRLGQMQLNSDNEFEIIYEAKDHLGNVRATFREGKNYVNIYRTEIEGGTLLNEQPVQGGQPEFEIHPDYLDMTKFKSEGLSALLSDGESIEIWLPVQNGDDLSAEVYFNSDELPENGGLPGGRIGGSVNPALTTGSLMSIGSMPNLGGEGKIGAPSININALAVAGLLIKKKTTPNTFGHNGTDENFYKSWIRMELYQSKDDAEPIADRFAQITLNDGDINKWESVSLDWTNLDMPDDWCEGFVKVYIENKGSERIWFDDISVEHTHNPGKIEVVSYKDYYPFGAEMRGSCIDNQGRYGYQGDYAEQDKETGWNAFELRMYDPLIGRSTSVDPYRQYHSPYLWVGNNPINMVDPDGGNAFKSDGNGGLIAEAGDNAGTLQDYANNVLHMDLSYSEASDMFSNIGNWDNGSFRAFGIEDIVGHTFTNDRMRYMESFRSEQAKYHGLFHLISDVLWMIGGEAFFSGAGSANVSYQTGKKIYEASKLANSFFQGSKYSEKVIRQMSKMDDLYHGFPKSVDAYASKLGKWSEQIGADGKVYQWLKMKGSYGGKQGVFEYIKDVNGLINHRYFNVK
jgi:RHS repeat-associated protein